ncbi:MAG TPA: 6,7-dimethyl-8-ribityllumazine synthase [Vicinamibacteria bacterium]|jgi:6,7-dimethyl-8-ribityllumazine synthase|nr:6,7-dimethyl-8-ribityllumazine synthase [Vicinamibacteria bacterium]
MSVAIVRSLFNRKVTDGLLAGAREALAEMGAADRGVAVYDLPGAFELPLAAQAAARSGRFDAVVALGAVIEGETDHYEHVAREAAGGLAAVARETGVPVAFGVLTVRQEEHACRRAAPGPDNKGAEAARAAVTTALALRAIRGGRGRRARAVRRRR